MRVIALLAIAWGLSLPLRDVLAYPDRISVLPNLQTDAPAYHAIAVSLATTGSLEALPPRHPPGWVSLLAALYTVTGPSFVAAKLVSWTALIASVAMCWYLARQVFGATAGWIAALVCAWSPALRGYVGTVQYEVVTGTGLLAVLVLALRTTRAASPAEVWRRAVVTGIAGALLILTRETFAIIVPLAALWVAHRIRPRRRLARSHGRRRDRCRRLARTRCRVVRRSVLPPQRADHVLRKRADRRRAREQPARKRDLQRAARRDRAADRTRVRPRLPRPERSCLRAARFLYFWGVLRDGWNVPRPAAVWLWRASTGLIPLEVFTAIARGGWLLMLFIVALVMLGRDGTENLVGTARRGPDADGGPRRGAVVAPLCRADPARRLHPGKRSARGRDAGVCSQPPLAGRRRSSARSRRGDHRDAVPTMAACASL